MGDEESSHHVPAFLLPDAAWKCIQKNTFTRWVNNHLQKAGERVENLDSDFSDGLRLIKLVEVLSHKHVGKHNKKVSFRSQKLENVSVALRFLQEDERIKIVNIDSSHIVDCNGKLVLGLVWTLIVHYSMSAHSWGDEEERAPSAPEQTPKQRLLAWIRAKLGSDVPVTNFTSDWNDGLALGALVESMAPGMVGDWRRWDPDQALDNTKKAMKVADEEMDIAQLITPEELINPDIDDKSVMTYLAQFPQAKAVIPKGRLSNVDGRPLAGVPSEFIVSIPTEQHKPKLSIRDTEGRDVHFTLTKTSLKTFTVRYTPEHVATYEISLHLVHIATGDGRAVADAVEMVTSRKAARVEYEKETRLGQGTSHIRIVDTEGASAEDMDVAVVTPEGVEERCLVTESSSESGVFLAEYIASSTGLHSLNIFQERHHVKGSPFPLRVLGKVASELRAWGRGLASAGVVTGELVEVNVDREEVDEEGQKKHDRDLSAIPVHVKIVDANGTVATTASLLPSSSSNRRTFAYSAPHHGDYAVHVTAEGEHVGLSPYKVSVADSCTSRVRAFGPGLEGGVAMLPSVFYVESNGEQGRLGFAVEGPSKTEIRCEDRGNGSAIVEYTPARAGVYSVSVLSGHKHIRNSPFVVLVDPVDANLRPSAVRVSGLDERVPYSVYDPINFEIDTTHAGDTLLIPSVSVLDTNLQPVETTVTQLIPSQTSSRSPSPSPLSGRFACSFQPVHAGQHYVNVAVRGVSVPGAPFPVTVIDPSRLRVFGPGVDGPVESLQPTHFTIDAKQAGPGTLEVALKDREGRAVDIDVLDNEDGSFTVKYTAPRPGAYQLNVVFAGAEIPKIEINVKPHVDVSGIRVEGLENDNVFVGQPLRIKVDPRGQEASQQGVEVLVLEDTPSGGSGKKPKKYRLKGATTPAGVYEAAYTPDTTGTIRVEVLFDGVPVLVREVHASEGCDPTKVLPSGDGLKNAVVGEKATFRMDTRNAGTGRIEIDITGPAEVKTQIVDNGDGTARVEYVPERPGLYTLAIMYGDERRHVPGSPFRAVADHKHDASKVSVEGLVDPARVGKERRFVVDASETAEGVITATLLYGRNKADSKQQPVLKQRELEPRVYEGKFTPVHDAGEMAVRVLYDGEDVRGSPFRVPLLPESDPTALRLVPPSVVPASRDVVILMDSTNIGTAVPLEVEVTGPDGRRRRYELTQTATEGIEELRFRTDLPGEYFVVVRSRDGDKAVMQKTRVAVVAKGRKEDITVESRLSTAVWGIGEERSIILQRSVDDPEARLALLETSGLGVEYAVEAIKRPDGRYEDVIRIRPRKAGKHRILVLYGGVEVEDGIIEFEAFSVEETHQRREKEREEEELLQQETDSRKKREDRDREVERNEQRYYAGSEEATSSSTRSGEEATWRERERVNVLGSSSPPSSSPSTPSRTRREANNNEGYTQFNGNSSPRLPEVYDERVFPFDFDPSEIRATELEAIVTMPSGHKDAAEIIDNHDGTVLVKYTPKTSGNHVLSILHQGTVVQGTPISFYVDQYSDGYATIYGPGTQGGVVGEPAHFTVCAKHGHAKELSVSIEGPAQANIKIHDNKDGTCSVSWIPPMPGEYKVHVKLAGKELSQSPFQVLVAGEGSKRAHLSVGSTSEVALNITESELKGISASIKSPSGIEEPCFVRIIEGGRLGVSFTPREAGEHLITVKRDGKLVPKAPFKIKVDKSQVGDASKVEVSGDGRAKALTQQWNEILVDTTKAGYGGLSVSVQGPSKAELQCKEKKTGLVQVLYKPSEPGVYAVAIKFADHHVKSSPLTVHCTGPSGGAVREEITKRTDQAPISLPDQEANLFLKLPNTSPMDSVARIMDPKGNTEDVEMRDQGNSFYLIKFKPKIEGAHALSVLHKDAHVNGSPFQFTVGSFSEGGAHKVRASGMGVVRGETNHMQTFNVYSREAGPGNLAVAIEGPSRATMKFEDHKDGNCHVDYKVATPGEYLISIKFNDAHIPDSPFKVFIAPATGEVRKLEIAAFHDSGVPVGKAFTFTVLTHRARGHLEAKVLCPNGETETIDIVPIEEGESYALRFVPKESGNHYIHVTLAGAPMRDSPFRLRVGGKDECDPTAIHATGEGLVSGQTGQKCEFVVRTANAGAGILTCQIDGPSKVTLDAYELDHGYKARYTPLAPGDYFAAVKYNGIHIPGSPFKIRIEGKTLGGAGYNETAVVKIDAVAKTSKGTVAVAPVYKGDATKVTAKGAGLNKFFPGRPAMFTIDTGIAGPNLLMVAVITTKGPCEEVVIKHQGNGHYICTYRIQDRVKGFVFIKYGDNEIPGSPFALEP